MCYIIMYIFHGECTLYNRMRKMIRLIAVSKLVVTSLHGNRLRMSRSARAQGVNPNSLSTGSASMGIGIITVVHVAR